eukprot:1879548-Ditylum_brightwellii.AAC.1
MNEAQQIYLKTNGIIDNIDHYIKNNRLGYVSSKYWHSAILHGTALAILIAYDFYKEVYESDLDAAWKKDDPADH